jgi:clan AA aspartic protease
LKFLGLKQTESEVVRMGMVYTTTEIKNIKDDAGSYSMPFLVDTGATDTVIPADELEKLGINREYKREYELADGSIVSYDIGHAFVFVNGEKIAANVIFGEKGCEPLLGVTVLESAGLIVDPVHQILRKISAIPLK